VWFELVLRIKNASTLALPLMAAIPVTTTEASLLPGKPPKAIVVEPVPDAITSALRHDRTTTTPPTTTNSNDLIGKREVLKCLTSPLMTGEI
jgi:hypothetical protein